MRWFSTVLAVSFAGFSQIAGAQTIAVPPPLVSTVPVSYAGGENIHDPAIPSTGSFTARFVLTVDTRAAEFITVHVKDDKGHMVFTDQVRAWLSSMSAAPTTTASKAVMVTPAIHPGNYRISIDDPAFEPVEFPVPFYDPREFAGRVVVVHVTPIDTSKPSAAEVQYFDTLNLGVLADKTTPAAVDKFKAGVVAIQQAGTSEAAESNLKKAVATDPQFYEAYYLLGLEQARRAHRSDAIKTLEKATTIAPSDSRAFRMLGQLYLQDEQYKKALASMQHAEPLGTLTAWDEVICASAYYDLNDFHNAVLHLQKAISLEPGKIPVAYEELVNALLNIGERDQALTTADAYLKYFPDDRQAQLQANSLRTPMDARSKP